MTPRTKIIVNFGPIFDISYHGDVKDAKKRLNLQMRYHYVK